MSEETKILATKREAGGTSEARGLRREGRIPAVVYTSGKAAKSVALNERDFEAMLRHHTSENVIVDLDIEGDKVRHVLLKEVQHHPVSGSILHIDFYEVKKGQKIKVDIPVELVGEPIGVTRDGGVLEHVLREVEVECLPKDLVEQFALDVSGLEIGDHLLVKDLAVDPSKYELLTDEDLAVAAVAAPRLVEEVTEEEGAEGAAGAEPEVIGEKKEDESEEG
ncbi:MAG: 50S ribosomal protein L25 [Verrucomicrobia bacterium]|nr:50S ribosomal protein L25 [Verrucomicrobiota bacterium]